jgi:hypothetical protein
VRRNFVAWDCKVTPADCACQEGNTTGCIPNNDGLGAGLEPVFPHCGKLRTVEIGWAWSRIPFLGPYLTAGAGVAAGVEKVVQSSLRDEVPFGCGRPSARSAGLFSLVPPGHGTQVPGDLQLTFVRDLELRDPKLMPVRDVEFTSGPGGCRRGGRGRVAEVCGGRGLFLVLRQRVDRRGVGGGARTWRVLALPSQEPQNSGS